MLDLFAAHFIRHVSEEKKEDKSTMISELRERDDGSRYTMARRWNQMHKIILKGRLQSMHEEKELRSSNSVKTNLKDKLTQTKNFTVPAGIKQSFISTSQPTPSALMKQSMQKSAMTMKGDCKP